MTNLNTLFDFSKFEKRKPADQQVFENDNTELLVAFVEAVDHSFQKLHTKVLRNIEPIDQDKNLCATVMSGYLCGFFKRNYPHLCGKATRQRFKLWLSNTSVYIKKLDEKTKLPSNIPTDESLKIHYQLTDTGNDNEANIFLGYTRSPSWAMITGIFAECIEGQNILWTSNLSDLRDSNQASVIPIPPKPISPKVKPGVRKRKTKNE